MKRVFALLLCLSLLLSALPVLAEETQFGYVNIESKLYMSASEQAVVQSAVGLGTQVKILEETEAEGAQWYKVTLIANGEIGWIKADDVDLVIAKRLKEEEEPTQAETGEEGGTAGPVKVEREGDYAVLSASGLVDPDTLPGAPKEGDFKPLSEGDNDDRVSELRARLIELGYLTGKPKGALNKNDTKAIKRFQKVNGLPEDGLATAAVQAKIFSANALNPKGQKLTRTDPITITTANVKASNSGGGSIQFNIKNTSAGRIDAFDFTMRWYNTYGERYIFKNYSEKMTLKEELTALDTSEERATLGKNQIVRYSLGTGSLYVAGCMIAITGYHTESGETVRIPEDQRHWYAVGKGLPTQQTGYQELLVTPLTTKEEGQAKAWELGLSGSYLDAEIASAYGQREGLMITEIKEGSPAAEAGLQKGDILLAIGDTRIFGMTSVARAMAAIKAGKSAETLFLHNGSIYRTEITRPKAK